MRNCFLPDHGVQVLSSEHGADVFREITFVLKMPGPQLMAMPESPRKSELFINKPV